MDTQFFPTLSQNFLELLNDDEYYDVTIEVGEDPNVKIFRAHMNILCYRSPYLRRALATNKKNSDNDLAHIKFQNITPEIFQIVLMYIYGGILPLNGQETSNILDILVAADILRLQELVDYLQKYLIKNRSRWMGENYEFTQRISAQSMNLFDLRQFCTEFIAKFPEKIFKSPNFTSLPEESLVQLIKRDDLQMKEVEIWEHVLRWGLGQNPILISDPNTWSDDDFKAMEYTLQRCLPSIRFFCLSSKEFSQNIRPYKKLLNHQLYEDLSNSYLDPDSVSTENILLPRNFNEIIDSKIVNLSMISTISRWIDKVEVDSKFSHFRELYLPYKFELLLRGSRDGFTPKKFHQLCNNRPFTVSFVKVKGTEEILGGYNPVKWESSGVWGRTKYSFIYSFKNKNNFFKDLIVTGVKNVDFAVANHAEAGPYFGEDLVIYASDESINFNYIYYKNYHYENKIRDIEDKFSIEDYEVFQVIRR